MSIMKSSLILAILFPLFGWAQSIPLDSLMRANSDKPDKEKISILMDYGKQYCNVNPSLSITLVEKALEIAENTGDPLLISEVLNGLAITNYLLGNNAEALTLSIKAIDNVRTAIEKHPDSTFLLARLQTMYANTNSYYKALGNFEKSLEMLQKASNISDTLLLLQPDDIQNKIRKINVENNIAVLHWNLGNADKAREILDGALSMARNINSEENIIITLNNIGVIQIDEKEYPEAKLSYEEVLSLSVRLNDSISVIYAYNNLGQVMEKMQQLPKALAYFRDAYNISRRLGFSIGISSSSSNIAMIYPELNKPDSALYFVKLGMDEAKRSGDKNYQLKSYETLVNVYEKLGKSNEALEAYKTFVAIKDSIFNTEKSKQIAEMEAKYESEKKEQENQILRQTISIKEKTSLLLIISVAALLLLALLLYYFYRLKNKALNQQSKLNEQEHELHLLETARLEDQLFAEQEINRLQNEKLEQQNRELSTRILHAINKNEAMNNIIHALEKLKEKGNHNINDCFIKVSHIVKDNISLDKDWDQFKLHFEEVNPGFFYKLQEQFPELTQNEQKLCAYYRINLDTKEIARILNVTNAAIQKSRHRLRKKMDIPSETEMNLFMSRF
jgi:tetratricopeptide (TPR) repeat protein